jgi:hypothetical protein
MLRSIGAVILGYIIFALTLFLTFSTAYLLMGANLAFQPETYEPSNFWLIVSFILGFAASMVGGYACALIARRGRAPLALAVLVLVLGVLANLPAIFATNSSRERLTRPAEVSNLQAMQNAVLPSWVALLNPFLGAAGVVLGASLRRRPQI